MTLLSLSLDGNSICHTRMLNQKPILASEVTQVAITGRNWQKKRDQFRWDAIDLGMSLMHMGIWEFCFFFDIIGGGTIIFEVFLCMVFTKLAVFSPLYQFPCVSFQLAAILYSPSFLVLRN